MKLLKIAISMIFLNSKPIILVYEKKIKTSASKTRLGRRLCAVGIYVQRLGI